MDLRQTAAAGIAAAAVAVAFAPAADAHRNGCHPKKTCPSDHATYKWRGKLCAKPSSPERTSALKQKVRHAGKTYHCRKA